MYSSTDESFGTSRRKMAQRSLQRNTDRAIAHRFQPENFNFQDFPLDVATQILVLATATSGYWRTYQSLIVVSHAMRDLVYDTCLPYLPVMLHTKKHVDSFCLLLASHPTIVGHRVRSLWFIAGVKAGVEREAGLNILNACTGITHLACRINLLSALVYKSGGIAHHKELSHLTLVETIVPWELLLHQPAAKPTSPSTSTSPAAPSTSHFPAAQFPVLEQIVPSIPYKCWRLTDPKRIRTFGLEIDGRMEALSCPKKWKEADEWESARRGGNDLWTRVGAGEYLQKSRAFTLEPRRTYRIADNDSGDFGWDSDEYGPFGVS